MLFRSNTSISNLFEELIGTKPTDKEIKVLEKNSRKLVKAIQVLLKKDTKKKSKKAKSEDSKEKPKKIKKVIIS